MSALAVGVADPERHRQRDTDLGADAVTEAAREPSSLRTGRAQVCAEVRIVDAGLEYAAAYVVRLFEH